MKKIKMSEINSLEKKLTDEFLEDRKDGESGNTESDISFVVKDGGLSVYYNNYGEGESAEDYLIEDWNKNAKNKSLFELMGIDNKDPVEVLNNMMEAFGHLYKKN